MTESLESAGTGMEGNRGQGGNRIIVSDRPPEGNLGRCVVDSESSACFTPDAAHMEGHSRISATKPHLFNEFKIHLDACSISVENRLRFYST